MVASLTTIIGTARGTWNKETGTQAASFDNDGKNVLDSVNAPGNSPMYTTTTGRYRISPAVADQNEFNQVAAFFYSDGSAGKQPKARIWGISQVEGTSSHVGVLMGELTRTVGSGVGTTDSGGAFSGSRFVNAISVDTDSSNLPPGIRILGDNGNRIAMLLIDAVGFRSIVIELIKGDLDANKVIGVVWRVL